jgi:hypothetical protein
LVSCAGAGTTCAAGISGTNKSREGRSMSRSLSATFPFRLISCDLRFGEIAYVGNRTIVIRHDELRQGREGSAMRRKQSAEESEDITKQDINEVCVE